MSQKLTPGWRFTPTKNYLVLMQNNRLVNAWRTQMFAQSLSPRTVTERVTTVLRMGDACDVDPADATVENIALWLANPDWSARTRWTYHASLNSWFQWLQKQGFRDDNPMMLVGKPRRPRSEPKPVTDREMHKLLRTRMRKRTRAMVLLASLAGLRVHEIAKVRAEDFDLVERTLTVVGKGNVTATLPLHHLIIEHAYLMPREGYWFPGNDNGHQRRESVSQTIKEVMVRAGVKGSAHCLRHWFGTTLVDEGVDLRTTQELLRHASLATTQIYTRVSESRRLEGVDKLDPFRAINTVTPATR